jgi:hypothetical protein
MKLKIVITIGGRPPHSFWKYPSHPETRDAIRSMGATRSGVIKESRKRRAAAMVQPEVLSKTVFMSDSHCRLDGQSLFVTPSGGF